MAHQESTAQGFVERVQGFVSENRRAILIGTAAAAIAVGGAVYYASTSHRTADSDVERRSRDKRKGKKRKTTKDKDGPILEERSPQTVVVDDAGEVSTCAYTTETHHFFLCVTEEVRVSPQEIAAMSEEVFGQHFMSDLRFENFVKYFRSEPSLLRISKPKVTAHTNSASLPSPPTSTLKPSRSRLNSSPFSTAIVQLVRPTPCSQRT